MTKTTPEKPPRKPAGRSKITNGSLGDMDGRGKWARRLADLIELYGQDICANPATLPQTTQGLIRRAATITVELERAEASFAKEGGANASAFSEYQTGCNTLRRLLQDLQAQVKSPEQIHRPSPPDADARFIRSITITNNPYVAQDMALMYGRDDQGQRVIARELAFVIEDANRHGTPLPKVLAEFAVTSGLAEYDDAKESSKETVIDLNDYRH